MAHLFSHSSPRTDFLSRRSMGMEGRGKAPANASRSLECSCLSCSCSRLAHDAASPTGSDPASDSQPCATFTIAIPSISPQTQWRARCIENGYRPDSSHLAAALSNVRRSAALSSSETVSLSYCIVSVRFGSSPALSGLKAGRSCRSLAFARLSPQYRVSASDTLADRIARAPTCSDAVR